MRNVNVLVKRKGQRNIKQTATCGTVTSVSTTNAMMRPNVKLSHHNILL
jgi:hypothetical protein